MYTNINIKDSQNTFSYIIEYKDSNELSISDSLFYINNESIFDDKNTLADNISFWTDNAGVIKHYDHWFPIKGDHNKEYIPTEYATSKVVLYFPDYSVDTYTPGVKYSLNISTFIHGHTIVLASKIIDRIDALACPGVKTFANNKYYECVEFDIVNPRSLIYSDDWKEFRNNVCGESVDLNTVNSTGSVLYVTLYPVVEDESGYRKIDIYDGGQNSINIINSVNDYLHLHISTNINNPITGFTGGEPGIKCELMFNDVYENNISEYLFETYGLKDGEYTIEYELVIGNDNDLYVVLTNPETSLNSTSCFFKKSDITKYNLNNWEGYTEGINIVCSANIINNDDESILYLLSNSIPLTREIFKYFVGGEEFSVYYSGNGNNTLSSKLIHNINLNNLDMNIININAVNKIVNNVVKLTKPEDSKAGLIQPAFFRVMESTDITIHPVVTETICINLDMYKSKVTTFLLQIDGVNFTEIGRTQSGVLFKIPGGKLSSISATGVYYILNQESELVTTGKYNSIV